MRYNSRINNNIFLIMDYGIVLIIGFGIGFLFGWFTSKLKR